MRRLAGVAAVVVAGCLCESSRDTNGWCSIHQFGYVGGVKVTSRWLYDAADAHGHDVDVATFVCPTCKSAIATDGFCELDRIGFIDEQAYFSRLTYELGRAEVRPTPLIKCPTCRKNAETHGWCAKSGMGMVGPFAIRNRQAYDRAVTALEIFVVANTAASRCKYCAVAMIMDTECPACKISYKGGKTVPRGP